MKRKKTSELVGAIIGAIIGLVIVNTIPFWSHLTSGVILESWTDILWAANLSMVVTIIGNLILIVYRPARLCSFIQAIIATVGLVSLIVFYNIFPLDFSQVVGNWLNILIKGILILVMFGTSIAIIINLVRAVVGTPYTPELNT